VELSSSGCCGVICITCPLLLLLLLLLPSRVPSSQ